MIIRGGGLVQHGHLRSPSFPVSLLAIAHILDGSERLCEHANINCAVNTPILRWDSFFFFNLPSTLLLTHILHLPQTPRTLYLSLLISYLPQHLICPAPRC